MEPQPSQLLLCRLLVLPEIHQAERKSAAMAPEPVGRELGSTHLMGGFVLGLQRVRQPPKMPSGERRETEPDCESPLSSPLGHVEVDASLQGSRKRSVGGEALPQTEGAGGVLHGELDAVG